MLPRNTRTLLAPGLLMALIVLVALAGCGASASGGGLYGSGANTSPTSTSSAGSAQTTCASSTAAICTRSVQVSGKSEQVLVTPAGKTLYYFTADSATTSACSGSCVNNWPPLTATSASVAPISGLTGQLTTINRDGGSQIAYNGHPLYTFAADSAPGDTKGQGVNGKWFVATPDLAPASSSGDGGYGY